MRKKQERMKEKRGSVRGNLSSFIHFIFKFSSSLSCFSRLTLSGRWGTI